MKKWIYAGFGLALVLTGLRGKAQPFIEEIRAFKKQDSLSFPQQHAILFTGSSSIRIWTDIAAAFPGYPVINRGFGGSTFPDMIRYVNDIVIPYKPRQVFIYCGDNDLAKSDTVSAGSVYQNFLTLFWMIRKALPQTNIQFIALKPSPSRTKQMPKEVVINNWAEKFLSQQKNTGFVDVYHKMLTPEGKPKPEIFRPDSLHMNEKGYQIWQAAIKPHLLK